MDLPFVALAGSAIIALVGGIVVAARRATLPSLAVGSLLILWGAGSAANSLLLTAGDLRTATAAANLSMWYSIPIPLLLIASVPLLVEGRGPGKRVLVGLSILAVATLAGLALFAADRSIFVRSVAPFGEGYAIESGPLQYAFAIATVLVEAGSALYAATRARDPRADVVVRQRAALVAVGIGVLAVHLAGFFVVFVAFDPTVWGQRLVWGRIVATFVGGAIAAWSILRATGATAVPGRSIGIGAVALSGGLGVVDGLVRMGRFYGIAYPGYDTSLLLVRLVFALTLGLVALRYGLANAGAAGRRTVARVAAGLVGASLAAAAAALAFLVLGGTLPGLAVAATLGVSAPLMLRARLGEVGRALAHRLLLPPDDPRAVAERARTYAAALAASQGAGEEGARYLAALRADLGISEREHELLAQGVASREKERYHALQTLGRGATAQVELAMDELLGQRVVVKRFRGLRDPAAALKEARALAAVKHARVVPFLEVDRRGDELYLVIAYAEGGSARQLIDRDGPLAPERAVALGRDLLEGLEALHAAGVVHCDVKPENLLLDAAGRGMLGDFGSARFVAPDVADATLTGADAAGSLSTLSPEALRGAPPAPGRDVYASGALLYRLLTGEHYVALEDATVFEARERILLDAPRLPHPRVPASIEPVLRKALAKKPAERYASAREMREALERTARSVWAS